MKGQYDARGEGMKQPHAFWDDLAADLEDPDFAAEYAKASLRITACTQLIHNGGKP